MRQPLHSKVRLDFRKLWHLTEHNKVVIRKNTNSSKIGPVVIFQSKLQANSKFYRKYVTTLVIKQLQSYLFSTFTEIKFSFSIVLRNLHPAVIYMFKVNIKTN